MCTLVVQRIIQAPGQRHGRRHGRRRTRTEGKSEEGAKLLKLRFGVSSVLKGQLLLYVLWRRNKVESRRKIYCVGVGEFQGASGAGRSIRENRFPGDRRRQIRGGPDSALRVW